MPHATVLEFVVAEFRAALIAVAADPAVVTTRTAAFEADVREFYGGRLNYVHGEDKAVRNARVRAKWAVAVTANGRLAKPVSMKILRDRLCEAEGIKRSTLENIIAGRTYYQKNS